MRSPGLHALPQPHQRQPTWKHAKPTILRGLRKSAYVAALIIAGIGAVVSVGVYVLPGVWLVASRVPNLIATRWRSRRG